MNKIFLLGRLGKDATITLTPSGVSVLSAVLATSEKFKGKDGKQQEITDWHNLKMFGKTAESLAPYLTKGLLILVEGKSKTRSWNDKTGKTNYITEVHIERVEFCSQSSYKKPTELDKVTDKIRNDQQDKSDPWFPEENSNEDIIPF